MRCLSNVSQEAVSRAQGSPSLERSVADASAQVQGLSLDLYPLHQTFCLTHFPVGFIDVHVDYSMFCRRLTRAVRIAPRFHSVPRMSTGIVSSPPVDPRSLCINCISGKPVEGRLALHDALRVRMHCEWSEAMVSCL